MREALDLEWPRLNSAATIPEAAEAAAQSQRGQGRPRARPESRETNGRPCTIVALTRLFVEGCKGEPPAANLPHACHLCRSRGHRMAHGDAPHPAARAHRLQSDSCTRH